MTVNGSAAIKKFSPILFLTYFNNLQTASL